MVKQVWEFAVRGCDSSSDEPKFLGFFQTLEGAEKFRANAKAIGWRSVAVVDANLKEIVHLDSIFSAIERQILNGKTYLSTSKALLALIDTDLRVFQTAPTFFGMTAEGGLELAQMTIARLYDQSRDTVTIHRMLEQAKREAGSFKHGDEKVVRDAIGKAERTVAALESIIKRVKLRRHKWFAHLDVRTVTDPHELDTLAKLTIPDLDRVFQETEKILSSLENLFEGLIGPIRYVGGDDYTGMLARIRHSIDVEGKELAAVLGSPTTEKKAATNS
jgi:hypothetical protein